MTYYQPDKSLEKYDNSTNLQARWQRVTCKWSRSAAAAHRCLLATAEGTAGFLLLLSDPADAADGDRGRHSLLAGIPGTWTGSGVVKEMAPARLTATLLPAEAAQPDPW